MQIPFALEQDAALPQDGAGARQRWIWLTASDRGGHQNECVTARYPAPKGVSPYSKVAVDAAFPYPSESSAHVISRPRGVHSDTVPRRYFATFIRLAQYAANFRDARINNFKALCGVRKISHSVIASRGDLRTRSDTGFRMPYCKIERDTSALRRSILAPYEPAICDFSRIPPGRLI